MSTTSLVHTVPEVLARAESAVGRGTLYWLDQGGRDPRAPRPSSDLPIAQAWASLDAAQAAEVGPVAAAMGIDTADKDLHLPACDCTGFVCWALGFSRKAPSAASYTTPDGWIYTNSIWKDAMGPGNRFVRRERAQPGCLVVYPSDRSAGLNYGHVAIVVEVNAMGRATRIAHCSKANVLSAPHDAIKVTSPEPFEAQASSIYAWCGTIVE